MNVKEVARELAFPFTELAVLFAMITFALLLKLGFATMFGWWLLVVIVPAFFRYALYLLDARAHGRVAPVPGIEMFSWVESGWTLFPGVILILVIFAVWFLAGEYSVTAAVWALGGFFFVYPASMAVLAVTRSPIESLNPIVVARMVRVCGNDYFWIPGALIAILVARFWLLPVGLPDYVQFFLGIYVFFLLFTLTGAVLHAHQVVAEVEIDTPVEPAEEQFALDLERERITVANHAYGFISRGNRAGGFDHIRQWIRQESDREAAYEWFFQQMLEWESTDPAQFFAQDYLHQLLGWERDSKAVKLIARCLHENPRWRPQPDDSAAVFELLARCGRDDLLTELRR